MKNSKKLIAVPLLASLMATAAIVPTAQAELSASVGIANMYLWRGFDLGGSGGEAAVSGDITYSQAGFYAGVWGSSGDSALGTEYDVYLGYGGEAGDFSYDISYWSYIYPNTPSGVDELDIGDVEDIVISLGYGSAAFTLYESISESDGADDYRYYTFDYSAGDWNFLIGNHDYGRDADDDTHIQIGYSYNDNLSFSVSKFLDDNDGATDDSVNFLVSYSLDIK